MPRSWPLLAVLGAELCLSGLVVSPAMPWSALQSLPPARDEPREDRPQGRSSRSRREHGAVVPRRARARRHDELEGRAGAPRLRGGARRESQPGRGWFGGTCLRSASHQSVSWAAHGMAKERPMNNLFNMLLGFGKDQPKTNGVVCVPDA